MSPKAGMSVVELSIVVALLLLIAAISVPALRQNLQKKRAAACALNLDVLDVACKKYAAEQGACPAALSELVPDYLEALPACPSGGTYAFDAAREMPVCSVPGHHF